MHEATGAAVVAIRAKLEAGKPIVIDEAVEAGIDPGLITDLGGIVLVPLPPDLEGNGVLEDEDKSTTPETNLDLDATKKSEETLTRPENPDLPDPVASTEPGETIGTFEALRRSKIPEAVALWSRIGQGEAVAAAEAIEAGIEPILLRNLGVPVTADVAVRADGAPATQVAPHEPVPSDSAPAPRISNQPRPPGAEIPTLAEVETYLEDNGFQPMEPTRSDWYRPADGAAISDVETGQFARGEAGVVPVGVEIQVVRGDVRLRLPDPIDKPRNENYSFEQRKDRRKIYLNDENESEQIFHGRLPAEGSPSREKESEDRTWTERYDAYRWKKGDEPLPEKAKGYPTADWIPASDQVIELLIEAVKIFRPHDYGNFMHGVKVYETPKLLMRVSHKNTLYRGANGLTRNDPDTKFAERVTIWMNANPLTYLDEAGHVAGFFEGDDGGHDRIYQQLDRHRVEAEAFMGDHKKWWSRKPFVYTRLDKSLELELNLYHEYNDEAPHLKVSKPSSRKGKMYISDKYFVDPES